METTTKFEALSTFLLNLLCFSSEELAALYTESTLISFANAARSRSDRAYAALVATFPGGEEALIAMSEEDYTSFESALAREVEDWGNRSAHITDAIMVARRNNAAACNRAMAL
jgi:hypothetical protein